MRRFSMGLSVVALLWLGIAASAGAGVYTLDVHFDQGVYVKVNHDIANQLQLDAGGGTIFNHIWVACSGRDTAVRVDTNTGVVLGEYFTRPNGMQGNPSRTTVEKDGHVWVGNRNESGGGKGSMTQIRADATGPNTSTGVWNAATGAGGTFDARPWTNAGNADSNGGTSTAQDTAISQYVRTNATNLRTIAVDANNDVWTGGYGNKQHDLYDGATGTPVGGAGNSFNNGQGGYGGLIDGNGVLWSASLTNFLVRHDPATNTTTNINLGRTSYGLGIDSQGNIWNSNWTYNTITKLDSAGNILGVFGTGGAGGDRGVTVTLSDDNVWVANSSGNNVSRLDNAGNLLAVITVGSMPTGLSVDSNGKVWVTNHNSSTLSRIDPATNTVDLTVNLGAGATPYNYSDMTGTVLLGVTNPTGTWRVVEDSGVLGQSWDQIFWNTEPEGNIPVGGDIVVEARAADAVGDLASEAWQAFLSGDSLALMGQFLELRATLSLGDNDISPVLSDITVTYESAYVVPEPSTFIIWAGLGVMVVLGRSVMRRKRR